MSKLSKRNYSVVISAAVAASAMIGGAANAQSSSVDNLRANPISQNVTSVSQLSDVKPTDWAFTALQSRSMLQVPVGEYRSG